MECQLSRWSDCPRAAGDDMGAPGLGAKWMLALGRKGNSTITFNFNICDADARLPVPSLAAAAFVMDVIVGLWIHTYRPNSNTLK